VKNAQALAYYLIEEEKMEIPQSLFVQEKLSFQVYPQNIEVKDTWSSVA
jgi:hypothetical protein